MYGGIFGRPRSRADLQATRTRRSIVFSASKNVTAPGQGIRRLRREQGGGGTACRIFALEGRELANMLNPDAIFDGSRFWSEEKRVMRASVRNDASYLPDYRSAPS